MKKMLLEAFADSDMTTWIDKISQFRDEGLTYKQISDKLNKLGIPPTRGKVGEFTPQKVWSSYTKIKKNLDREDIYHPPDIEDVELVWE